MRVLQLYTSTRSFFENQVRALEAEGVDCTTLRVPGSFEPGSYRSVSDYVKYVPKVLGHSLSGYDVVHANWGLLGPFALAQPSRPVVLSLWGSDVMSDRRWLTELSRQSARLADEVILPSQAMRPALSCDHEVVPFGIDLDRFRPISRETTREKVGWDEDETVVLFPYEQSRPEKDHDRAAEVVDRADTDADLRVVTDVPYAEMPYYLNASDALLVTSTRESGPMVVKEAAACNVPVVSTDVGFVRETLTAVDNSHVCTDTAGLVTGLEAVLAGPGRSDARDTIEGLGLSRMATDLVDVYERAMDDRGATA
ncbi:glycosyltransferase family 4 protein [Halobacteriales archaeon Cl-PHB]